MLQPELRTTVVQQVLDPEDDGAFPSEDLRVEDVQWSNCFSLQSDFQVQSEAGLEYLEKELAPSEGRKIVAWEKK